MFYVECLQALLPLLVVLNRLIVKTMTGLNECFGEIEFTNLKHVQCSHICVTSS